MTKTKQQQLREARYRKQLKRCGFRSWKSANTSRAELVYRKLHADDFQPLELIQLQQLDKLADLYLIWKTNDANGRAIRALKRKCRRLKLSIFQ